MPPESCHGYLSANPSRPTERSACSTALLALALAIGLRRSGNSTFAATVIHGNSERL